MTISLAQFREKQIPVLLKSEKERHQINLDNGYQTQNLHLHPELAQALKSIRQSTEHDGAITDIDRLVGKIEQYIGQDTIDLSVYTQINERLKELHDYFYNHGEVFQKITPHINMLIDRIEHFYEQSIKDTPNAQDVYAVGVSEELAEASVITPTKYSKPFYDKDAKKWIMRKTHVQGQGIKQNVAESEESAESKRSELNEDIDTSKNSQHKIKVGSKVRSYDFPGMHDSHYIEGHVVRDTPHTYHIKVNKVVRDHKEIGIPEHMHHVEAPKGKGMFTGHYAVHHLKESVRLQEALDEATSPTAGTRLVKKYGNDANRAEVRYNSDYQEFQVHHYKDGKHMGEGPVSYHGDDKEDAHDTAKAAVEKRSKVNEEQLDEAKAEFHNTFKGWVDSAEKNNLKVTHGSHESFAHHPITGKLIGTFSNDEHSGPSGSLLLHTIKESEQLQELSKKTLSNYVKDASSDRTANAFTAGHETGAGREISDKVKSKDQKRLYGIRRAATKLAREDLDEAIHKSDVPAYLRKAKGDAPLTNKEVKDQGKKNISSKEKLAQNTGVNEADEKLKVSCHDAGMHAALKGKSYSSNPHPKGTQEHLEWSKGHNAMRAKKLQTEEIEVLDESFLAEGEVSHGKYHIKTGAYVSGMGEDDPEHVKGHLGKLKTLGVPVQKGEKYGQTTRVSVRNTETGDTTHHHVYQRQYYNDDKKPVVSVRNVGAHREKQAEHHAVLKDYLSGKKAPAHVSESETFKAVDKKKVFSGKEKQGNPEKADEIKESFSFLKFINK